MCDPDIYIPPQYSYKDHKLARANNAHMCTLELFYRYVDSSTTTALSGPNRKTALTFPVHVDIYYKQ